jgi:hypothetical protein
MICEISLWSLHKIMESNVALKVKPEIQDVIRSPFQAKHINDIMFIEDLSNIHQMKTIRHYI